MQRYLHTTGWDRSAILLRCYPDDVSRLPRFEAGEEAIAVNPSAALERIGAAQG